MAEQSQPQTAVDITHHDETTHGEYVATIEGADAKGRLTWKARGNARIADHTLVPPAIGGRGVALELVKALIADARSEGFTIVPQCSYVEAQFRKHPEWAELRAPVES